MYIYIPYRYRLTLYFCLWITYVYLVRHKEAKSCDILKLCVLPGYDRVSTLFTHLTQVETALSNLLLPSLCLAHIILGAIFEALRIVKCLLLPPPPWLPTSSGCLLKLHKLWWSANLQLAVCKCKWRLCANVSVRVCVSVWVCMHDEWQICIILSKKFHDNAAAARHVNVGGQRGQGGASKGGRGVQRRRRGVRYTDKPQILQHLHLSS